MSPRCKIFGWARYKTVPVCTIPTKGELLPRTSVELAMPISGPVDDNCLEKCCSSRPSRVSQTITTHCPYDVPCNRRPKAPVLKENEPLKKSCRSGLPTGKESKVKNPNPGDCSTKRCCSDAPSDSSSGPTRVQSCRERDSYRIEAEKEVYRFGQSDANDCFSSDCCAAGVDAESLISHKSSERTIAKSLGSSKSMLPNSSTTSDLGMKSADLEKGVGEMEHFVLGVQGMTCTSCETKLYRTLASIPTVADIKTSLVLSQAQFDMTQSSSLHKSNLVTTLEKMTGFTFTILSQPGEDLELLLYGSIQDLGCSERIPDGVLDVSFVDKNMIRVTYSPKVVGARDLLCTPYFRSTKLAPVAPSPVVSSGIAHVRFTFYMTLFSALLTIPVLVLAWAPLPKHSIIYGAISLGLATTVQAIVVGPLYESAFRALLFARMVEMDLLVVLSTTTAYVYSVVAFAYLALGQPLSIGEFFETSTLLVTLIMVGRTVSSYARHKAIESISIETLQTPTAILVNSTTRHEEEIDARLLQYGDLFKVLPECPIVTDGIVISGETEVDESMVTGENTLVFKKPGSTVMAGSTNHSGVLMVRLVHLPGENTITTITSMVDGAKSSKPKIQELADRVASFFVPSVLILTAVVFTVWVAIGVRVSSNGPTRACVNAMTYAISTLIVACPCAIGLAVPMVVVIAGGVGARHGLIFKSAETLEISRKITHVVFDKTGTLTNGKLSVVVQDRSKNFRGIGGMILGLVTNSKHPVSLAIAAHVKAEGIEAIPIDNVVSVPGRGIQATFGRLNISAGNPDWLGFDNIPSVRATLRQGLTTFCVSIDGDLVATFGLRDELRHDAFETIHRLRQRSVDISLISGDHKEAVRSIATQLNIPETNVRSRCSPGDKQAFIKDKLAVKNSVVLFCGDGTNDAVALAQASVGLHMNEGTELARSSADAILMRPSLAGIITLMDLSKACYQRIVFNFAWAFIYNGLAILLAAGAFPRIRISPQFAGLGEIVSVLPVIAIAVQLRWSKF